MATTRRAFLSGSAAALVTGFVGSSVPLLSQRGRGQTTGTFTPIRSDVGYFTGRGGTIGYLVNQAGLVVVDSQYPDAAALCLAGLAERSGGRQIDFLINTHHHADHTAGNIAFRGATAHVVAHETAARHMRQPPGRQSATTEQLYPDTTFATTFDAEIGAERVRATHYGRAHTSGDAVIAFERANVVHMGDLMFNRRHPVVDRPAGALMAHWIEVLEHTVAEHADDTVYIFGHGGRDQPVTGGRADLEHFRDYLTALLEYVRREIAAGRSEAAITAFEGVLPGFDAHGPLTASILGNAYGEIAGG